MQVQELLRREVRRVVPVAPAGARMDVHLRVDDGEEDHQEGKGRRGAVEGRPDRR